jgi:hypothetical protein
MKRIITTGLSALFVAVLFGVTGCEGGGGVEPGMPTETTPAMDPAKMKDMADMTKMGTPPPSTSKTPIPAKGTDAAPAPDAEKK